MCSRSENFRPINVINLKMKKSHLLVRKLFSFVLMFYFGNFYGGFKRFCLFSAKISFESNWKCIIGKNNKQFLKQSSFFSGLSKISMQIAVFCLTALLENSLAINSGTKIQKEKHSIPANIFYFVECQLLFVDQKCNLINFWKWGIKRRKQVPKKNLFLMSAIFPCFHKFSKYYFSCVYLTIEKNSA